MSARCLTEQPGMERPENGPGSLVGQLAAILELDSEPDSEEDEGEGQEQVLIEERDKAKEKLAEFEHASQTLLAELSALEVEYEIEKSCREEAEVYAAQMTREVKTLKWISTALLPLLSHPPEELMSLGRGEEAPSESAEDPMARYQEQVKDLQAKVSQLLSEKKELVLQVKELQGQLQQLQDKLEEEQAEKWSMQVLMERHQRTWKKVKQTCCLVTQEYGNMVQQLDLEKELRQQAESFAHQMLVKQKEANRQSMILMQNVGPDTRMLQALDEVASLTRELEEAKREHQAKVKVLEAQLAQRPLPEEMQKLQATLAMAEAEKVHLGKQVQQMEERNAALEERVRSLEEKVKVTNAGPSPGTCPIMAPSPPPPPPPPPFISSAPMDPLVAIRQRRAARPEKPEAPRRDDVRAKAVEEMMARIKGGVVLRPVGRDPGDTSGHQSIPASKRRSATMELQTLLAQNNMKRPSRRSSQRKSLRKKLTDDQLESILQRRRRMVDCPAEPQTSQMQSSAAPAAEYNSSEGAQRARAERACSSPRESPSHPKWVR